MSLFRNRMLLRRWARALALAWLFVLGAGIAHACAVDASHAVRAASPVPQAGHEHATDAGKCPAACADVSLSAPARGHDDGGMPLAGPRPLPAVRHRVEATLSACAEGLTAEPPMWRPQPISIVFLRLAL